MARRIVQAVLGCGLILGLAVGLARADKTVRVRGPTGTGYTDETTNDQGTVVRRQKYSEGGKLETDTRYDPQTGAPTGSTENGYDEEGHLTTATHKDGEGETQKIEHFDGSGRLHRLESFDEDGEPQGTQEWHFDADGNLVQISFKDGRGSIIKSFHYRWKDGKLVDVSANDETGATLGHGSYGADGNLESLRGDVSGALRELGQAVDPSTHVTQGPAGETIIVRHNADGTVDATIIFADQRVAHVWLRHGEGCYLGDQCPFHDAPPPDPSKAMRPARTGGLPADVPILRPQPDKAPSSNY